MANVAHIFASPVFAAGRSALCAVTAGNASDNIQHLMFTCRAFTGLGVKYNIDKEHSLIIQKDNFLNLLLYMEFAMYRKLMKVLFITHNIN